MHDIVIQGIFRRVKMYGVQAYHLILTAYGFWLPNDPRGSWSDFVRAFELVQFGRATKVDTHQSVAQSPHDHRLRKAAKDHLARPPVTFTGLQARAVGRGFGNYITKANLTVPAGVVMPDHAHLLIGRHNYRIEQIGNLLKGAATRQLSTEGLHPFANDPYADGSLPTPWARRQWHVFLNTGEDIARAVDYVHNNPLKAGLPPQRWSWTVPE